MQLRPLNINDFAPGRYPLWFLAKAFRGQAHDYYHTRNGTVFSYFDIADFEREAFPLLKDWDRIVLIHNPSRPFFAHEVEKG